MRFATRCLFSAIVNLFATSVAVQSQNPPIYIFTGEADNDQLGFSVASAGDVNNDGYDDVLVGVQRGNRVFLFSGLNGDTLYTFNVTGGNVAPAGDVNNDGFADFLIGETGNDAVDFNAGRAYVFSGIDGDTLHVFSGEAFNNFFGSVAPAGDVNMDGVPDFIVGAPGYSEVVNRGGRAYVYSGLNGSTLHVFTSLSAFDGFGGAVASAGDVNNDGYSDIIVGAAGAADLNNKTGMATVYSGLNGSVLYTFSGESMGDRFGRSVSPAGDLNGDGFDDFMIGADFNDANGSNSGRVYVFSGMNGDTLFVFTGAAGLDEFGWSIGSAGDVNNDGTPDIMIGAPSTFSSATHGQAYVFSGLNGDTLHHIIGEGANDWYGISVASAGDVNMDGVTDLIIGAKANDSGGFNWGRAYVYSGAPPVVACCVGVTGNIDCDAESVVDIADLTVLIDHLFINLTPLCCREQGNVDGDVGAVVDIADLTFLIDHLFINLVPTAACL